MCRNYSIGWLTLRIGEGSSVVTIFPLFASGAPPNAIQGNNFVGFRQPSAGCGQWEPIVFNTGHGLFAVVRAAVGTDPLSQFLIINLGRRTARDGKHRFTPIRPPDRRAAKLTSFCARLFRISKDYCGILPPAAAFRRRAARRRSKKRFEWRKGCADCVGGAGYRGADTAVWGNPARYAFLIDICFFSYVY